MQPLALNAVLLHHDARAPNDFTRVALPIDLAQASPSTEDFSISDFDEVDFVLGAESFDELNVLSFRACFDEDAKVGLAFVKGFRAFSETTSQTVVNECVLQYLL
jgi:hypothetical protein